MRADAVAARTHGYLYRRATEYGLHTGGEPTESGSVVRFQLELGRCLPSHFTHANITGHARYWDSFCRISIFSQLGPLASFILFAGPISGPAPAFISPVVLVLRG